MDFDAVLEEGPKLTLDPFADGGETAKEETKEETKPAKGEEPEPVQVVLTPQEEKMVEEFAARIDLSNAGMVLQYGAGAQKKIALIE